jgi:DNA-binding NtrC family response regulator
MATILCVDDENTIRVVLEHALTDLGHEPLLADSVDDAIRTLAEANVDLVLADYRMPGGTGLDLLAQCRQKGYDVPVIMMTAYSSIEHAVTSLKQGAVDYLTKPIQVGTLEIAIDQALELARLRRENQAFRSELASIRIARKIIGDSPQLREVLETIRMIAPTRATVMLQGESGTGKELLARAVHDQSPRCEKSFVSLNCAAIPEGLVESALFGHEKGAFTGATARAPGAFERADDSTLLLDEISEMRLDLQSRLLRVIQEQEFERVGGQRSISVDVRIIATTNRDLRAEVAAGRFREDLFYRLNVVPIQAPPLRERTGDIAQLVHHFVQRAASELGLSVPAVAPEAMVLLQSHLWPGNVRELENMMHRAVILSREGQIGSKVVHGFLSEETGRSGPVGPCTTDTASDGTARAGGSVETVNLKELEQIAIQRALAQTQGNRTRAAQLLGVSERTLRNKLNRPRQPA